MGKRIVATQHIAFADGREATWGQEVELGAEDEQSLEAAGALVPEVFDSAQEYHDFKVDSYRAARGDVEAANRVMQGNLQGRFDARQAELTARASEGGVDDVDPSDNRYIAIIRDTQPNMEDTIALAEGDPAKAAQVLEAEDVVSGGSPRKGVVEGLAKVSE